MQPRRLLLDLVVLIVTLVWAAAVIASLRGVAIDPQVHGTLATVLTIACTARAVKGDS